MDCYAGYRREQEPLAFWLGVRRLAVRGIVDRWFAPDRPIMIISVRGIPLR